MSVLTKQYENNNNKIFKVISRVFRWVYVVSRGFKGLIYEFRSCIGICRFLKSILPNNMEKIPKIDLSWFQWGLHGFQGGLRE
jgi:hypothetical protein